MSTESFKSLLVDATSTRFSELAEHAKADTALGRSVRRVLEQISDPEATVLSAFSSAVSP